MGCESPWSMEVVYTHKGESKTIAQKDNDNQVAVSKVTLNKKNLSLDIGKNETLKAIIAPDKATNKKIKWSSDKPKIASVSDSGQVKGLAEGTAVITVSTEDGNKTATCKVTVLKAAKPPAEDKIIKLTGISIKSKTSLYVGDKETLKVTYTPSNASDKKVTWLSSDPKIATVSDNGEVTGVAIGTTSLVVLSNDGKYQKSCVVTVSLATPTNLKVIKVTATAARVSWTPVKGATFYEVEYRRNDTEEWSKAPGYFNKSGVIFNSQSLQASYSYFYRVRAINADGKSGWTKTVEISFK